MNVAAGAITVFIKAYCHEIEGVEILYLFLVWFECVWYGLLWFGSVTHSFLRWNFSSRSRTIKTNHTCNQQSSATNASLFYARNPNHSAEDIIHFNGNRESDQNKKKKKFQPYNPRFLLILSKALARSSYTSICII